MIILDTDVLSALMRSDEIVVRWLDRQPRDSIWISVITILEIRSGLLTMPVGRKRTVLEAGLGILLNEKIQGRVAQFDLTAAERTAELTAARKIQGRPAGDRDAMIAGIALANRATLATRNVAHFADLSTSVVNPWTD